MTFDEVLLSTSNTITRYYLESMLATLIIVATCFAFSATANTKQLALVGNVVPTLIDKAPYPARANTVVNKVLQNYSVNIDVTTQAWSGSGLRNGKYIGFIDHYSLNVQRAEYLYSEPYLTIPLHIASRRAKAIDANRLDKVYRMTLGIENRFANTDMLRAERSVRWARTPDFLVNIKQLAERRVEYIIADKFMLEAFDNLLNHSKGEKLFLSSEAIYQVQLRLAIKKETPDAQKIIDDFNSSLAALKSSGELDSILAADTFEGVTLDEALYEEIVKKW